MTRVGHTARRTTSVGRLLTRARSNLGLSQGVVAGRIGVTRPQWTNIEQGRSFPAGGSLWDLCKLLKIDPTALLRAMARDARRPTA